MPGAGAGRLRAAFSIQKIDPADQSFVPVLTGAMREGDGRTLLEVGALDRQQLVERRTARIHGFHRQFCLWARAGRGSPERPGLMLSLQPGGSCTGVAYRLAERVLRIVPFFRAGGLARRPCRGRYRLLPGPALHS